MSCVLLPANSPGSSGVIFWHTTSPGNQSSPAKYRARFAINNVVTPGLLVRRLAEIEPAAHALDTAFRVNDALFTSPEWVALAANFDNQLWLGRANCP
jgi:hypothetical protein